MVRYWLKKMVVATSLVLAFAVVAVPVTGLTVHAQDPFGGGASAANSTYGGNTSTCAIETVGWVICPVMRSIAKLADFGFAFVNQNYLRLEYDFFVKDNSGVYGAWLQMRNLAYALFVVVFMIIVYFFITGRTTGNFNLKRIVPRLIVTAILTTISWWICVPAIDLSNIVGDSVLTVMKPVAANIGDAAMTLDSAKNGFDDSRLSDITSGILTKSGTVWILLAPVAAVTIAIAIVCAAMLVLLIMRKVVVSMLVLVSPLVFVAYMLPNLEHLFRQWMRVFLQLLVLYPIIALLLGTGQIISATIVSVGSGGESSDYHVRDDNYQGRNGGSGSATTDLAAAGAAVLPLIGAWFLLKNLTSLVGSAGLKLSEAARGLSKESNDKLKAKLDSKIAQQPGVGKAGGLPQFDRRPAFSRKSRKHKASPGGSARAGQPPTGGDKQRNPGAAQTPPPTPTQLPQQALDNLNDLTNGKEKKDTVSDATKTLEKQKTSGENSNDLKNAIATALKSSTLKTEDKKGSKAAKDIFNNMNKTHQSKDQQRVISGGQAPAAAPQGGGGAPTQASSSGPSAGYSAPSMMQAGGIPTAAQAPAQPTVIAVPVQVDAASFLGQGGGNSSPVGMPMPSSEIEQKAKARAEKYIFESGKEAAAAAESALDAIQQHKRPEAPTEQPHTSAPEASTDQPEDKAGA